MMGRLQTEPTDNNMSSGRLGSIPARVS